MRDAKVDKTAGTNRKSTTAVGGFSTPPSVADKASRQKITKDLQDLNNTIKQLGLIDIFQNTVPRRRNTDYFQVRMEYFKR